MLRFIGFCALVWICAKFVLPLVETHMSTMEMPHMGGSQAAKALKGGVN
jgi:hypothetical protein